MTNHLLHQWHDLCAALDAPLKRPLSSYLFGHQQLPELDSADLDIEVKVSPSFDDEN